MLRSFSISLPCSICSRRGDWPAVPGKREPRGALQAPGARDHFHPDWRQVIVTWFDSLPCKGWGRNGPADGHRPADTPTLVSRVTPSITRPSMTKSPPPFSPYDVSSLILHQSISLRSIAASVFLIRGINCFQLKGKRKILRACDRVNCCRDTARFNARLLDLFEKDIFRSTKMRLMYVSILFWNFVEFFSWTYQ